MFGLALLSFYILRLFLMKRVELLLAGVELLT